MLASSEIAGEGPIVVLTGAGISAESGIPTFRGAEGYWRVGSRKQSKCDSARRRGILRRPIFAFLSSAVRHYPSLSKESSTGDFRA